MYFKVCFSEYSYRHFCKTFAKKYHSSWDITKDAIIATLERFENNRQFQSIDILQSNQLYILGKLDFSVAGTKTSPKASGNRLVFIVNIATKEIEILLVYAKTDIAMPGKETVWIWKSIEQEFSTYYQRLQF